MPSYPELGNERLVLWRLVGETQNELFCEVEADGDRLVLLVGESGTGNAIREVHADIEPLVHRADDLHDDCIAAGWQPLTFDEELSP